MRNFKIYNKIYYKIRLDYVLSNKIKKKSILWILHRINNFRSDFIKTFIIKSTLKLILEIVIKQYLKYN